MGETIRSERASWRQVGIAIARVLEEQWERSCKNCTLSVGEQAECFLHSRCSAYVKVFMDSGRIPRLQYNGPMFRFVARVAFDEQRAGTRDVEKPAEE